MHNYRKILSFTLLFILAGLIAIAAIVIVIDPAQHYHSNKEYWGNQRMEIGGVAKNHDYDAAIFGSSMAMNHYPALADSLWGWNTKNFSIMGATDEDYSIIIPYILKQGKVKNVIWGIDFFSFARSRGAVPEYIYDDNILTDCRYLWNYSTLEAAFKLWGNGGVGEENLYHFNSDANREALLNDFNSHLKNGYNDPLDGGELFDLEKMKYRFDNSVYKIIKNNRNITYYIYLPPYSIAEFLIYAKHGNLESNLEMRNYIASRLIPFSNVRLFDFQCKPWITNLNEYMDLRHHSHDYNKKILTSIKENRYRIKSASKIDINSQDIKRLILQYQDSLLPNL